MELTQLAAHKLLDLLQGKEISCVELTQAHLQRIQQVDGRVKAFVTLLADQALERASGLDRKRAAGEDLGPLAGIPMALKDNLCTRRIPTTCSSRILENFVPPYDATVVERLDQAGAVLLGKLNMDEFAMGSSTENSRFFTTHNPWDLSRVPGGSSGGATASVAAGEAVFTLGSDTGGSIRQPAAFCGVVGMKPTYGRVSRYGLIAFASSLDQIGPMTRDVTDCALVLQAISGRDFRDSTSADVDVPDYRAALTGDIRGMRLGIPREYFVEGIEPGVREAVERAIEHLAGLGAECLEVSLPHTEYALPAYYLVAPAEASSNLARYDGVGYGYRAEGTGDIITMYSQTRKEGFGPEVKRRVMLGTYALSSGYYDAYYLKALKARTLILQDFDQAFEQCDALITPTSPTVAFPMGERSQDPLSMYMADLFTIPMNLAGIPGISIPCGFSQGLPVGMQIVGRSFDEATILCIAHAFEQTTDYHRQKAALEV